MITSTFYNPLKKSLKFFILSLAIILTFSYSSFSQPYYSATDSVVVTTNSTLTDWGRGFSFSPTHDIWVTELGKRVPQAGTYTWIIWEASTQTKILEQVSVVNQPTQWAYEPADTIVKLEANTTYIMELYGTAGYYYGISSQAGPHINYINMTYCNSCAATLAFPTSTLANYHYGTPDFIYSLSPPISGPNDAAVYELSSPKVFCAGTHDIIATISNRGTNQIDSVEVHWEINDTLSNFLVYRQLLDTLDGNGSSDASVNLGSFNFQDQTKIRVWTSMPNGVQDTINLNDTIEKIVTPALVGAFTIDSSRAASATNFVDIESFTDLINSVGVCGPVTVNIAPQIYNERLYLGKIPGTSAINTITIDGGDSSQTIIETMGGTGTNEYSPFVIDGASYVTVRNIGFRMIGTQGSAGLMTNNSKYNTIENCYFGSNINSTLSTIRSFEFSTSPNSSVTQVAGVKYNTFKNNRFIGGYYGVYLYGNSVDYNETSNNSFIDNIMDSAYYYGVYASYMDSTEFIGNTINAYSRANISSYGLYVYFSPNPILHGNTIHSGSYGLHLYEGTANTTPYLTRPTEVVNNMITTVGSNYGFYCYYVRSLKMLHNSINASGTYATYIYTTSTYTPNNYDIRNNIFNGGTTYNFYMANITAANISHFDHNLFNGPSANLIYFNGAHATLAAFQSSNPQFNRNSLQMDPEFVSSTDLHIDGSNVFEKGDNSAGITVDIDGEERPIPGFNTVSIGADEFYPDGNLCDMPIDLGVTEVDYFSAKIFWNTASSSQGFEYVIVPCDESFVSGTVVATSSDSSLVNGLLDDACYKFYVRSACNSFDTSYYAGPYRFMTKAVPYYPISTLNTSDVDGGADSLDVIAYTSGTVVGVNLAYGNDIDVAIVSVENGVQEGIRVRYNDPNNRFRVLEGDSLLVRGTVKQDAGLTYMELEGYEVVSTGRVIPTADAVSTLDETTESTFIELENFVLLDGSSAGTYDMRAFNGSDTIIIRVEGQTDVSRNLVISGNELHPYDTICYMNGIGGQYDPTSPYTGGYHIIPMDYSSIQVCKAVAPYYPIGILNTSDADGVADSIGVHAWTSGTVVGVNLASSSAMNYTIIDMSSSEQEGINIVSNVSFGNFELSEGDSIKVRGVVEQNNGLTQFRVTAIEELSRDNIIPEAIHTTTLDEETESKWLAMEYLILLDSSETGSYYMRAHNDEDTIMIYVNEYSEASSYFANSANALSVGDTICFMNGVGGQIDSSSSAPYLHGYYITLMRGSDVDICYLVGLRKYSDLNSDLTFYPNPTNGSFTIETSGLTNDNAIITIRDVSGKLILDETISNSSRAFKKHYNLEGQAKGLYFISIIDGNSRVTKKLILQ